MQETSASSGCHVAEGPEGLERTLVDLFEQSQQDSVFTAEEHYILYQLGQQKSLIRVDMSTPSFQFWYYDLWGRPATSIIKETIARFLLEKTK